MSEPPKSPRSQKSRPDKSNCSWFYRLAFVVLSIAISFGCYLEYKVPRVIDPVFFETSPLPVPAVDFRWNDRLTPAIKVFQDMVQGPASFAFIGDVIYVGSENGSLIRLQESRASIYGPLIFQCEKPPCSRPLGMRYDVTRNRLVIADAYLGVYEVDQKTDNKFIVTLFNDVDFLPDGRILVSETSSKYDYQNRMKDFIEGRPNGRVLLIDPAKKTWKALMSGLYFPTGVQFHRDGVSALVAEAAKARIWRISLESGDALPFGPFMPGLPGHIRASPRSGYWIPMVVPRYQGAGLLMEFLFKWPRLRANFYKIFSVSTLESLTRKQHAIIVRLGENGKVMETLQDSTGKFKGITEAGEHNDYLYIGSATGNFIGKLKLQ